jgi:hypothetical protein
MKPPADYAEAMELAPLPPGEDERFIGYGVMGQPFASGHVLAMRRFPRTSLGAGYTAVWHCDPDGRWRMWADVPPLLACPRYFGPSLTATEECGISVEWPDPWTLDVRIGGVLDWHTELIRTPATTAMSALASRLPDSWWNSDLVLGLMGRLAGPLLRAEEVRLHGLVPSEQWFTVNPLRVWATTNVRASFHGESLGESEPVPRQRRLGGFPIPNRGLFAIGRATFETYQPDRHVQRIPGQPA